MYEILTVFIPSMIELSSCRLVRVLIMAPVHYNIKPPGGIIVVAEVCRFI